ncbi:MAG: LPS export ABC transporter periplasmic protein LptC [candidate division WOR-3 bacterium]|nr:MAG: LPS export ABC transporter periplasmic protein LptC [candidate division WOR-3 bacterium]
MNKKLTGVLLLVLLAIACDEEQVKGALHEELPRIIIEEFSLTETRMGEKLWILDAELAREYQDVIKVDSVKIRFYNKEQVEFSVLYAPGGILNKATHNVLVGDTVIVMTNDSTKLFTDSLFWMNDSQVIMTNRDVMIIKQDSTIIEGTGLRADPYLEKIEILGTTKGVSPIELPDIR